MDKVESSTTPPKNGVTKRRTNVIVLAILMVGVVTIAVIAALVGAKLVPGSAEALLAGAIGGAIGVTSALSMLAKSILEIDAAPFDAQEAAHLERMEQIKNDRTAKGEHERIVTNLVNRLAPIDVAAENGVG